MLSSTCFSTYCEAYKFLVLVLVWFVWGKWKKFTLLTRRIASANVILAPSMASECFAKRQPETGSIKLQAILSMTDLLQVPSSARCCKQITLMGTRSVFANCWLLNEALSWASIALDSQFDEFTVSVWWFWEEAILHHFQHVLWWRAWWGDENENASLSLLLSQSPSSTLVVELDLKLATEIESQIES